MHNSGKTSVDNIESGMSLPLKKVMQERLVIAMICT